MSPQARKNRDAAVAQALATSVAGDHVVIHHDECAVTRSRRKQPECNCQPITLVVGAQA